MESEEQISGISSFDPLAVHELICQPSMIDCVTPSAEAEIQRDKQQRLNGPTILQQGLSIDAFRLLAADPQALISIEGGKRKPVIFVTGASLGIIYDNEDFDGLLTVPEGDVRLGGMAQGLKIEGVGPVTWTFCIPDGSEMKIRSQYYLVPEGKVRLISPQQHQKVVYCEVTIIC